MSDRDAWGYVRLSQEGDASIEEQKESIRQYATGFKVERRDGTGLADGLQYAKSRVERIDNLVKYAERHMDGESDE